MVDSRKNRRVIRIVTASQLSQQPQELRSFALPVIAVGTIIAILYFGRVLFITSITAVILAFLLEPFVVILVRLRFPRAAASFTVWVFALLALYLVGLGAYSQVSGLISELPVFSQRLGDIVEGGRRKIEAAEDSAYKMISRQKQREAQQAQQAAQAAVAAAVASRHKRASAAAPATPAPGTIPEVRIHEDHNPVADYISARLGTLYEFMLMASFVPFLVYFMLSWSEHIHRSFLQFFHGADRVVAAKSLQGIGDMVRAFVVGNFVLGLLLAVVSSIAFWILGLPFPFLAGSLSGFLSLVPYVGLPLALLPPAFVALIGTGHVSALFAVMVVVTTLHLVALNVFYPKLVGSRVHLNPLVVTFALMFWGFLWDAPGLLLAIPLTAAIKAVCDHVRALRPYGRFLGD